MGETEIMLYCLYIRNVIKFAKYAGVKCFKQWDSVVLAFRHSVFAKFIVISTDRISSV